jgi:3-hydroxyisobutyrate dehydrogenase
MTEQPTVAVLGTGTMGAPMARNLLQAGHEVRVWNRSADKAQPLEQDGATVATSAREAAEGADVVVTMLAAGEAVEEVAGEAIDGDGGVWAQMSTVGLEAGKTLAALARERGVTFVDAPVLGTKAPAEQGKLIVLAAGAPDGRERCAPIFDTVGAKTIDLGEDPVAGQRLKVVLNAWIVGLVEALGETMALAKALGVEQEQFLETISGGPLDTPYAQVKGKVMISGEFDPSFALRLARKDAGLALAAAEAAGIDLPAIRATAAAFDEAIEAGHGYEDMAATYATLAPADG